MNTLTHFPTLKSLLKKYRVWAKKRFGQNFLIDQNVLDTIIHTSHITKGQLVIEIGPGPGVLTQALLNAGVKVEAIEIDHDILPVLRESTRKYKSFLTIYEQHVLDFTPPKSPYKLISNIPYHLTSPIVRKFLGEVEHRPEIIVFLVQKEVAQKICERPGRDSQLSMMVKAYGDPEMITIVPAESFYPPPKVQSAVMKITVFDKPRISIPPKVFEQMLFAGFAEPRKKLRNVLMRKFHKTAPQIEEILSSANISGDLRAQNLSLEDWERLARIFFAEYV